MAQWLKQSTEIKVVVGPIVEVANGYVPVTTLSLSSADEAELIKSDASSVTDASGATFSAITSADGYYNLTLTSSFTDTVGLLTFLVNDDSLCLPYRKDFMVLPANIYDSLVGDSDLLDVSLVQINGDTTGVANLEESTKGIVTGSATATTLTTTTMSTDLTEATDDHYIGRAIVWTTGALAGQASDITDYDGSSKLLTFTAVTEAPSSGDEFCLV